MWQVIVWLPNVDVPTAPSKRLVWPYSITIVLQLTISLFSLLFLHIFHCFWCKGGMSFETFVLLTLNSGFFAQIGCFLENSWTPASLIDGKKLQIAGVNILNVWKKISLNCRYMKILISKFGHGEKFFVADFKVVKVRSIMHLLPKRNPKGCKNIWRL